MIKRFIYKFLGLFSTDKITNPLKKYAERFIKWLADENNDIAHYAKMYGLPWVMLTIIMLWSSWNAGNADYSVLYANDFNINFDEEKAESYAFWRALFIQLLILVPGSVIAKIFINGLQKQKKHKFQLWYLIPIALSGFCWSLHLSLQMGDAARAESHAEKKALEAQANTERQKNNNQTAKLDREQEATYISDSTIIATAYRYKYNQQKSIYRAKRDSLIKRSAYLEGLYYTPKSKGWMIAQARKINNTQIPNLKKQHPIDLENINAAKTDSIYRRKQQIIADINIKKLAANNDFIAINSTNQKAINTLESDTVKNGKTRMLLSVFFNLISLIITFGQQEVYKQINKELAAQKPVGKPVGRAPTEPVDTDLLIPVGDTTKPVDRTVGKPVESERTLAPQEFLPPPQIYPQKKMQPVDKEYFLWVRDTARLKKNISTSYARCFLKSVSGEKGSARQKTVDDNKNRQEDWISDLRAFGIGVHINFEEFEPPVRYYDIPQT